MKPVSYTSTDDTRIVVFDTTLRDGEQAPGFSLDVEEKLRMAAALARLRVDVVEAGFPASSLQDREAVARIAEFYGANRDAPVVCALARCVPRDIEVAAQALAAAAKRRIHVFLATSDLHLASKLRIDRSEALRRIASGVALAREHCTDVEFSAEDASRSDPSFLVEALRVAVDNGATTINVPDTVGYATPGEITRLFTDLRRSLPADVVLSAHCHDDLGLATANTLAAIAAGARQVECAVNGIGERAGNAALEEVVMALATRSDTFGWRTGVDSRALGDASRLLASLTGCEPAPNKAIVGANAFAHEAGIHQHGVLADRRTYEIMTPESVGRPHVELVLGKHSGRHALERRLSALGIVLPDGDLERVFDAFKLLCSKRKRIFDADLLALVADQVRVAARIAHIAGLHVVSGTSVTPTATVRIATTSGERLGVAIGDGPVDAVFRAIESALGTSAELVSYHASAAAPGKDALGSVQVEIERGGQRAVGRGLSTDTVEAAARAYLDALESLRMRGVSPAAATGAEVSA